MPKTKIATDTATPTKAEEFRQQVLLNRERLVRGYEQAAVDELASALRLVHTDIRTRVFAANAEDPTEWSYNKLMETERLRALIDGIEYEVSEFNAAATEITRRYGSYSFIRDADWTDTALKGLGITPAAGAIDIAVVDFFVNFPIAGVVFGERFMALEAGMRMKAREAMINGLVVGKGAREISRDITKVTELNYNAADVIVRTTMMNASNAAHMAVMEQAGIKEVARNAAFDARTCAECFAGDGEIIPVNRPDLLSLHPRCRCVPEPVVPDWPAGERRGKDYTGAKPKSTIFPPETTGRDYLEQLPTPEQVKVLGVNRVRMLQAGDVEWNDLWNKKGELRLLKDLARVAGREIAVVAKPTITAAEQAYLQGKTATKLRQKGWSDERILARRKKRSEAGKAARAAKPKEVVRRRPTITIKELPPKLSVEMMSAEETKEWAEGLIYTSADSPSIKADIEAELRRFVDRAGGELPEGLKKSLKRITSHLYEKELGMPIASYNRKDRRISLGINLRDKLVLRVGDFEHEIAHALYEIIGPNNREVIWEAFRGHLSKLKETVNSLVRKDEQWSPWASGILKGIKKYERDLPKRHIPPDSTGWFWNTSGSSRRPDDWISPYSYGSANEYWADSLALYIHTPAKAAEVLDPEILSLLRRVFPAYNPSFGPSIRGLVSLGN